MRCTTTIAYRITLAAATSMPASENSCSGTSENPVTRSKLSRTSLYSEYFDSPAARSSWPTSTSTGLWANV